MEVGRGESKRKGAKKEWTQLFGEGTKIVVDESSDKDTKFIYRASSSALLSEFRAYNKL